MSTRSPRKGTPSASSRRRWRSPWESEPSARTMRCHDPDVPWQRIVRADGSLSQGERQRRLLDAEGVPFRGDRVDMREAWVPV